MSPAMNLRPSLPYHAVLLLLAIAVAPAQAQTGQPDFSTQRRVMLGYVANAPNIFYGAGAMVLNPSYLGFFADVRLTRDSPGDRSNFVPGLTPTEAVATFGDFRSGTEDQWLAVNAGVTRVMTPELAIYVGAGYSSRDAFVEYFDETGARGELGYYWVQDDELSGPGVNLLGGLVFRAGSNLAIQLGAELRPLGATLGIYYALPGRR